ncbi:MAG: hypothetical protein HUU03_11480 [Planctomycetaceae bacterium]|nr:hypothetical protein [Planctomycetota bacterium]NUO17049.1 hypothetical protein [Planctomycetaceae bacterium]GIK53987.1 MAG: hypothetical protein BroJett014_29600 [Planctomycetota bacterium]
MNVLRHLISLMIILAGGLLGTALPEMLVRDRTISAESTKRSPASLVTSSVTLVDKQGKKRLTFNADDIDLRISFHDQNENRVMTLAAKDDFTLLLMNTSHADNGGAEASISTAEGDCGAGLISHRFKSDVWIAAISTGAGSAVATRWGEPDAPTKTSTTQTARVEGGGLVVTTPARQGDPNNGGRVQLGYSPHSKQMDLRIIDEKGKILWNAP